MASRPYYREAMRQLADLLPTDDEELNEWLEGAYAARDEDSFTMLWAAAGTAGRTLSASLIPAAMMMRISDWHLAWLAWRMRGDVTEEFLRALGIMPHEAERFSLFVLMAAAWWKEHRPEEEMPQEVTHFANILSKEKKLNPMAIAYLADIAILLGGQAKLARGVWQAGGRLTPKGQEEQLGKFYALLHGPFDRFLYEERSHDYSGAGPQRRALEPVGRNEKCPCASGKKYKQCCEAQDRARLRNSSCIAGLTKGELGQVEIGPITEKRLQAIGPAGLAKLDPQRVPRDMQAQFVVALSLFNLHPEAIAAFRTFSEVQEDGVSVPAHLHLAWSRVLMEIACAWRPDLAREMTGLFPDAEEKLGDKTYLGVRAVLVGDDPAQLLKTIERELRGQLGSDDLDQVFYLTDYLIKSPYSSLGIFLARSLLPILQDERKVAHLFSAILDARARMNLAPEDEFSDYMDERALRKARQHDSTDTEALAKKLERASEAKRASNEQLAELKRELALKTQQQRRAEATVSISPDLKLQETIRDLQAQLKGFKADAAVKAKEKQALRSALEKSTLEIEELRAAKKVTNKEQQTEETALFFAGNQPVRLIEFPKGFAETLTQFPQHAGRAVMKRIGLIAAGDKAGFDKIKQLKAYPGVLRARVSDKFRLFFTITADRVRIVDLIWRDDLDRWVKQLLARGLRE